MFTSHAEAIRRRTARSRRLQPVAEGLEDRMLLYATLGASWVYGSRITYSFAPDGTNVGGTPSAWFQTMNNRGFSTTTWQQQFQKAAAVWESVANINLVLVGDDGSPYDVAGNQQGDSRFGDIRIAGIAQSSGVLGLCFEPPPINGGTLAGDIVMNTSQAWQINSNYDIETVAIHELGHALGMDHSSIQQAVMYASYTGVKQTLNSDDSAGLQSVYGTRPNDAFEPNYSYPTASNITSQIDGNLQISLSSLDITTSGDADFFYVVAPAGTTGTMTVKMQSTGLSSLSPRVLVASSSYKTLGDNSRPNSYGDTATVTITGVTAGTGYYIRAIAAGGAPSNIGGYGLQVNFGSGNQVPIPPPYTVVAEQPDQGGGSIGLATSSLPIIDAKTLSLLNGKNLPARLAAQYRAGLLTGRLPAGEIQVRLGNLTARGDLDIDPRSVWGRTPDTPDFAGFAGPDLVVIPEEMPGQLAGWLQNLDQPLHSRARSQDSLDTLDLILADYNQDT